ncbi:MAG: hypothetical protein C0505_07950 [Leptothrix sp. (in: Bacteria)]|nr:hypothetical protein [Leptothrix sp. (in: b-proteobacteria)]
MKFVRALFNPFLASVALIALAAATAVLAPVANAQAPAAPAGAAACPALLQHSFPRLQDEAPQPLCQYAGKALGSFDSNVTPGSAALVSQIEKALVAR